VSCRPRSLLLPAVARTAVVETVAHYPANIRSAFAIFITLAFNPVYAIWTVRKAITGGLCRDLIPTGDSGGFGRLACHRRGRRLTLQLRQEPLQIVATCFRRDQTETEQQRQDPTKTSVLHIVSFLIIRIFTIAIIMPCAETPPRASRPLNYQKSQPASQTSPAPLSSAGWLRPLPLHTVVSTSP
jgi:hypothetical protein